MEHKDFIRNKKYHAYLKGVLVLRYLQDGLCDYVKDISERQHEAIKKAVGLTPENNTCNCNIRTLKPHSPTEGPKPGKYICPKNKKNCTCVRKEYKECKKKICDVFMEAIIDSEENGEPNWKNPNILSEWQNNSWEIQKLFIKSPGYDKTKSADDTDAVGLLILMAHNKFFQNYMEVIPDKKIQDWRGALFHGNMELEDQQLASGIEDIKTVLQDEKCLKDMECSKRALRNIQKLETESFYLSNEDEINVSRDALAFIKQKLEYYDRQLHDQKRHQEITEEKTNTLATDLSELAERVDTHEEQIKSLDQRVSVLEKEREEWKKEEDIQKAHLKKVEGRKELRRSLAAFLGKNYVTTSACPLKPQENVIEISDVYVKPDLTNITNKTPVTSYNELFERNKTRLKRIFILGDVGCGKSAFCQMLMHNWVKSVNGYWDIEENQTDICTMMSSLKVDEDMPEKSTSSYDDMKEMRKFDYLFYIPLRRLPGYSDICEMIKKYYERVVPSEVLKDVLQNCPEKCLIITDGIDEWSPGQRDIQPEHETYGLPSASDIKQATILMTSRPSSPGILAMKSSESDQKILLQGINDTKELAKRYYAKLKEIEKDCLTIETILSRLETVHICDLDKSPLVLKYIVWLLCIGSEVGGSVSEVYCNILNILLRWTDGKPTQNQSTDYFKDILMTDSNENMKHLHLPRLVEKYPSCNNRKMLIFALGIIAFELLIHHKYSEMTFGRNTLIQNGVSEELVQKLLKTGLLTEENRFDPTYEDTQFSFMSTSFLGYFAALFITSHPGVQTDVLTNKTNSSHFKDVLGHLFRTFSSTEDVLQLENVLILACGVAPYTLQEICKHIYSITLKDTNVSENLNVSEYIEDMVNFKMPGDPYPYFTKSIYKLKFLDVQDLVVNCLSESRLNNEDLRDLRVPLAAIVISKGNISDIPIMNIDPLTVLHLFVFCCEPHDMSFIDTFDNLRTIHLHHVIFQQNTLTLLCKLVSQTCSLRLIYIEFSECRDHEQEYPQHVMDLSRHSELQLIRCMKTKMVKFEHINTSSLEHCVTDRTHVLRQVMRCRNLKTLMLNEMHILDKTDIFKLLIFINISFSLRHLHLVRVDCEVSFESRKIDLSRHHHLKTLKVNYCDDDFCFTNIAETNLEICHTSNDDVKRLLQNSETLKMSPDGSIGRSSGLDISTDHCLCTPLQLYIYLPLVYIFKRSGDDSSKRTHMTTNFSINSDFPKVEKKCQTFCQT